MLRKSSVKPETVKRYTQRLAALRRWARAHGRRSPLNEQTVDRVLEGFLEELFAKKAPLAEAQQHLAAVQCFFPAFGRGRASQLHRSRQAFRGYRALRPP